jgi:hypothetical protein
MDNWAPADMKVLSPKAFIWLARLLNRIEDGAPWPSATTQARAKYLAKTDN